MLFRARQRRDRNTPIATAGTASASTTASVMELACPPRPGRQIGIGYANADQLNKRPLRSAGPRCPATGGPMPSHLFIEW